MFLLLLAALSSNVQFFSLSGHQSINIIRNQTSQHHKFDIQSTNSELGNLLGCSSIGFTVETWANAQGPFHLIVDTGSSTTAIASYNCVSCQNIYHLDPLLNTTKPDIDTSSSYTVSATYGGGSSWTGFTIPVSIQLFQNYSNPVMTQIVAITESNNFFSTSDCTLRTVISNNHAQGIIGMSYKNIAVSHTDSYIEKNSVSEFTLQLCDSPLGGNMWINGYDTTFFESSGQYATFGQYTYLRNFNWFSVDLLSIQMLNSSVNSIDASDYITIIDSGSTNIILPQPLYSYVVNILKNNQNFVSLFGIDFFEAGFCIAPLVNNILRSQINALLPNWTFQFSNNVVITLDPISSYLVAYPGSSNGAVNTIYCPGISVSTASATFPSIVLGYSFMNQQTIHFDIENNRIGFANTKNCGVNATAFSHFVVSEWSSCTKMPPCQGDDFAPDREIQYSTSIVCIDGTTGIQTTNVSLCTGQRSQFQRLCPLADCKSLAASQLLITILIIVIILAVAAIIIMYFFKCVKKKHIRSRRQ